MIWSRSFKLTSWGKNHSQDFTGSVQFTVRNVFERLRDTVRSGTAEQEQLMTQEASHPTPHLCACLLACGRSSHPHRRSVGVGKVWVLGGGQRGGTAAVKGEGCMWWWAYCVRMQGRRLKGFTLMRAGIRSFHSCVIHARSEFREGKNRTNSRVNFFWTTGQWLVYC